MAKQRRYREKTSELISILESIIPGPKPPPGSGLLSYDDEMFQKKRSRNQILLQCIEEIKKTPKTPDGRPAVVKSAGAGGSRGGTNFAEILSSPDINLGIALLRTDGTCISLNAALLKLLPSFKSSQMSTQIISVTNAVWQKSEFGPAVCEVEPDQVLVATANAPPYRRPVPTPLDSIRVVIVSRGARQMSQMQAGMSMNAHTGALAAAQLAQMQHQQQQNPMFPGFGMIPPPADNGLAAALAQQQQNVQAAAALIQASASQQHLNNLGGMGFPGLANPLVHPNLMSSPSGSLLAATTAANIAASNSHSQLNIMASASQQALQNLVAANAAATGTNPGGGPSLKSSGSATFMDPESLFGGGSGQASAPPPQQAASAAAPKAQAPAAEAGLLQLQQQLQSQLQQQSTVAKQEIPSGASLMKRLSTELLANSNAVKVENGDKKLQAEALVAQMCADATKAPSMAPALGALASLGSLTSLGIPQIPDVEGTNGIGVKEEQHGGGEGPTTLQAGLSMQNIGNMFPRSLIGSFTDGLGSLGGSFIDGSTLNALPSNTFESLAEAGARAQANAVAAAAASSAAATASTPAA